jgi:hypothetical protein
VVLFPRVTGSQGTKGLNSQGTEKRIYESLRASAKKLNLLSYQGTKGLNESERASEKSLICSKTSQGTKGRIKRISKSK